MGVAIAIGRDDGLINGVVLGDATLNCFLCLVVQLSLFTFPATFSFSVDGSRDNCSVLEEEKKDRRRKKNHQRKEKFSTKSLDRWK